MSNYIAFKKYLYYHNYTKRKKRKSGKKNSIYKLLKNQKLEESKII